MTPFCLSVSRLAASLALGALLFTGTPSLAQSAAGSNLVAIGGMPLLRIRTAWVGLTPEVRAIRVQQRLNDALAKAPLYPRDIQARQLQGDWVVLVKGKRLFTADPITARDSHTTPQALAMQWTAKMRRILPELTRPTGRVKS